MAFERLKKLWSSRSAVFVSHSSKDDSRVEKLMKVFEDRRIKVFVDFDRDNGISPSEKWEERLQNELADCEAVILCITPAWLESTWCLAEYKTARLAKKPIIPIVLERCDHKDIAADIQKLDVSDQASPDIGRVAAIVIKRFPRRRRPLKLAVAATLCALGLVVASFKATELGRWGRFGPGGGFVAALAADSATGAVYTALTHVSDLAGGLFRSDDCGRNWRALSLPPGVEDVNSVLADAGRVMIATDHGLWESSPQPPAWASKDDGTAGSEIAFIAASPLNPEFKVSGTPFGGGVSMREGLSAELSSSSAGAVMTPTRGGQGGLSIKKPAEDAWWRFPLETANDVAFSPTNSRVAYVVSAVDGVWFTRDGFEGLTQIKSFPGKDAIAVTLSADGKIVFVGTLDDGLWIYDIASESWRDVEPLRGQEVVKTFSHPRKPQEILIGASNGLFVTAQDAKTFMPAAYAPPAKRINVFLACGEQILVGTGGAGVFRRGVDQEDWLAASAGMGPMSVRNLLIRGGFQLVAADAGLYRSLDGGGAYELMDSSPSSVDVLAAVETDTAGPSGPPGGLRQVGAGEDALQSYRNVVLLAGNWRGEIWRKALGAADWRLAWQAPPRPKEDPAQQPDQIFSLAPSRWAPGLVVATTREGAILRSTDFGASWSRLENPGVKGAVTAFDVGKGRFILSTRADGVGLWDPAASTFSSSPGVDPKDPVSDLTILPSGIVMAVSVEGRVYRSEDGGANFTPAGKLPLTRKDNNWSEIAYSRHDRQLFAGTDFGPFVSADEGKTWNPLSLGGKEAAIKVTAVVADPTEGDIALVTRVGVVRPLAGTVLCLGRERCFSLSPRNIAGNLSTLFESARDFVVRHTSP